MTVTIVKKNSADKEERLTLRIAPKYKFALELLARKNKSSLSAIVMESIEPTLRDGLTVQKPNGKRGQTVYIPDEAYDPLVPDRLVKLAMVQPDLLSEQEQVIWKVIKEEPNYWTDEKPNFKTIRDRWSEIKDTAKNLIESFSG